MSLPPDVLRSRALWNRDQPDLASDEVLTQLLDRGELSAWREIYRLAAGTGADARALRARILRVVTTVPIAFPYLWRAALRSLGEPLEDIPDPPPYADGGAA